MDISEHINSNGLSRAEVCAKARISRAYLSLIESGQRQIGPNSVKALADALGVSIRDLRPDLADVFAQPVPMIAPTST
ncbi:MAG: transcriptional regulator [Rhodobacteraceae bacterium]|nr:transcriptional regulator [Paracoccaceae bacterium]